MSALRQAVNGRPQCDDAAARSGGAAPGDTGQQQSVKDTPAAGSAPPPVYAVLDRRHDGRPRLVGAYADPLAVRTAADLLRDAGAAVQIVLATEIQGAELLGKTAP